MLLPNVPDLGQDFSTVTWELLSEFDKAELRRQKKSARTLILKSCCHISLAMLKFLQKAIKTLRVSPTS